MLKHSKTSRPIIVLSSFQILLSVIYFVGAFFIYSYDSRLSLVSIWNGFVCTLASALTLWAVNATQVINIFPTAIFFNLISVLSSASFLGWVTIFTYELFRNKTTAVVNVGDEALLEPMESLFAFGVSLAYTSVATGTICNLCSFTLKVCDIFRNNIGIRGYASVQFNATKEKFDRLRIRENLNSLTFRCLYLYSHML